MSCSRCGVGMADGIPCKDVRCPARGGQATDKPTDAVAQARDVHAIAQFYAVMRTETYQSQLAAVRYLWDRFVADEHNRRREEIRAASQRAEAQP